MTESAWDGMESGTSAPTSLAQDGRVEASHGLYAPQAADRAATTAAAIGGQSRTKMICDDQGVSE
jgi:hypothetical protein